MGVEVGVKVGTGWRVAVIVGRLVGTGEGVAVAKGSGVADARSRVAVAVDRSAICVGCGAGVAGCEAGVVVGQKGRATTVELMCSSRRRSSMMAGLTAGITAYGQGR